MLGRFLVSFKITGLTIISRYFLFQRLDISFMLQELTLLDPLYAIGAIIIVLFILLITLFVLLRKIGRLKVIEQGNKELAQLFITSQERLRQEQQKQILESAFSSREELGHNMLRIQQLISSYQSNAAQDQAQSFERLINQLSVLQRQLGETLMQQFGQTVDMNSKRMQEIRSTLDEQLMQVREVMTNHLTSLQTSNENRLEEMRRTVDEKLHETLEKRVGESFKQVADRLEQVHRGLGEMQQLAQGVGDLKHLLSNVKTRGIFGEMQLAHLLEQVLVPEQYKAQAMIKPNQREVVDFAIMLPGRNAQDLCWLPIDAKFPIEDYERLLDAQQAANIVEIDAAGKALESRIRQEAKSISEKYIAPPHTTDFAILFLPTEGLYAEVLRRPGLMEQLQQQYHVTLAGPTTLYALLNSLQMGFKTLALEKRSAEVWRVLGAVKTEFTKFGDVLARMRKQLQSVSNTVDMAQTRTRQMNRALKEVETLPENDTNEMLPLISEDALFIDSKDDNKLFSDGS